MKRSNSVISSGWILLLLSFAPCILAQSTSPPRIEKAVVEIIEPSPSVHEHQFRSEAVSWLRWAGVEAVKDWEPHQATLTIQIEAKGLSATYYDVDTGQRVGKLATGFQVEGTLVLDTKDRGRISKRFKGSIGPGQYASPGSMTVPFEEVLHQKGSYVYALATAMSEVFGFHVIVAAAGEGNTYTARVARDLIKEAGARAFDPLVAALENPSAAIRTAAVENLREMNDPRAVEPVIAMLGDPKVEVRTTAARALGALKDRRAVEPLTVSLQDETNVALRAAEALGELGDPRAIPALIAAIRANSQRVTSKYDREGKLPPLFSAAFSALRAIGAPSIQPLTELLFDENALIRKSALAASGIPGNTRALGPLIAALEDADTTRTAAHSLGRIGDKRAVAALMESMVCWNDCRTQVEALQALTGQKYGFDRDGDRQWKAWWEKNKNAYPTPVEPLVEVLRGNNEAMRLLAVNAIGDLCGDRAVEPLCEVVAEGGEVSVRAAWKLGALKNPEAIPCLVDAVRKSAMERAVWALGEIGPEAVGVLTELMANPSSKIRITTATALGRTSDERAIPILLDALDDDYDVAHSAALAVSDIADKRIVANLIRAMNLQNERRKLGSANGILIALRKLTGQFLEGTETVEYWNGWWEENRENYPEE